MVKSYKKSALYIITAVILLIIDLLIYKHCELNPLLLTLRSIIQIPLLAFWCISIQNRIVNTPIRRVLIGLSAIMMFLLFVRSCKLDFTIFGINLIDFNYMETTCLIIIFILESIIQCGIIQSNSKYIEIFDSMTIPVLIVDEEHRSHYVSAKALHITEEQMQESKKEIINTGKALLHNSKIHRGRVIWQDDITQLNVLIERLQDTQEQLSEENTLLQAELDLKERRAKADEKNRLYDRIAKEVEPQLVKIDDILKQIDSEPDNTHNLMVKVCVIGSYVKRRGNLLLIAEENDYIQAKELEYCIRESLDNLRLGNVFTAFDSRCEGKLSSECIIALYDLYENLVENLLNSITAMMINLDCSNGKLKMNIQMGCEENIAQQILSDISLDCGMFSYTIQDEDVIIDITVSEGGVLT